MKPIKGPSTPNRSNSRQAIQKQVKTKKRVEDQSEASHLAGNQVSEGMNPPSRHPKVLIASAIGLVGWLGYLSYIAFF
ncbi:MAG: hypothetical protein VX438_12095 [Planctomycetota bacterium]|nr:hypothetical protein [Planctomycetota bacterium]